MTIAAVLTIVLLLLFWGITTSVVRCSFQNQLGVPCPTCGVSRDIFNYLQLDFKNPINKYSMRIFVFFVGQIILRTILWLSKIKGSPKQIRIDILLSTLWAVWTLGSMLFS